MADRGDYVFNVSDQLTDSGAAKKLLLSRSGVGYFRRRSKISMDICVGSSLGGGASTVIY